MRKSVLGLMMLAFGVAACAVESPADPAATTETMSSEITTADEAAASQSQLTATCFPVWECEICGSPNRTRNVLYSECDDGTWTIIRAGACGQACF